MAIAFTSEQQKVIEMHNCNALVSAAAGSGKTAVLVERIIQTVCDEAHPVDIDRLLVVTFTNAAASQMRERIAQGIAAKLEERPESEHIQKQAALLHNAQITTIDSFCLFLLRNHFNEIGLDPAFRIADEGEVKLMQQETMQELMEEGYRDKGESFRFCVEYFCPGGKEKVLEQHILNLSRYAASFPFPEEWLLERKKDYQAKNAEDICDSDYGRYLCAYLQKTMSGCMEKLTRMKRLCEEPDGPYMYGELAEQELVQLEALAKCRSLTEYELKLPAISFGRLSSKKDESISPAKRELAKRLRNEVKDSLQRIAERFFATSLELSAKQGNACMEPVEMLVDLTLEFDRRMREKKREKKIVDFSDMEHYALNILLKREGDIALPSAVALEYRQHFAEVLIDEYQDSNLVQEYLLKAVSGEEDGRYNRFMVGDVKQSIYKFRLARPELFLEKYDTYMPGEGDLRRIDLSKNFRSRTQVVNTVNSVFSKIMSRDMGGIEYDADAALYSGAVYPDNEGCESEMLLVEKPDGKAEENAKQIEARAIAARIKELKAFFKVTDKESGTLRPVNYSDIVILLRTNSGWDEEFKQELEKEGIPVYITSKTGYFSAVEVQELLQFLRMLDNPTQDIPLFGVMKSIFGGFTEEELARLRSGKRNCSLYEAVCAFAQGEAATEHVRLKEKVEAFLKMLEDYRSLTAYMPIRELLTRVVSDFDYLNYVTALPAGSRKRANVEMLFTKASDFEKTSYFGLFHFIRYIEQLEKYDVDYGEAELLDENADVVRIMSIHKSKGLEFPVTFVCGLSKRFNMQDSNQSMIADMDMGIATDYVDPVKRVRNRTLRRSILSEKLREESLAEELRVLYVALTRAKEKLILTATAENASEIWEMAKDSGMDRLTYLDFVEAGSFLDLLMPILPKTDILVTVKTAEDLETDSFREQVSLHKKRAQLEHLVEQGHNTVYESLKQRIGAVYAYENLSGLYTKTTVSELKIAAMADKDEAAYHTFEEEEVQPFIPRFRRGEEKVSGTVRGNAYHRAMEILDFDSIMAADNIGDMGAALHSFLLRQVEERRLSKEYFEAIREEKIVNLLSSELGQRMLRAEKEGKLYREQPFVMGVGADRLGQEFPKEETVLIQGIIDVFFEEEDGLVLLDYKTDSVGSMEELWNRYETQLDYYREALQNLKGQPVKERLLYSFHLERY